MQNLHGCYVYEGEVKSVANLDLQQTQRIDTHYIYT